MGITLTFDAIDDNEIGKLSWPLRVSASSDVEGLDSNIFVFHAQSVEAATPGDMCEAVASIVQMNELPVDEPTEIDGFPIPFYRKSEAEFHFHTSDALDEAIEIIKEDTASLLRAFRTFELIQEQQVVIIE
jgi:hypothetical protein